MKRLELKQPFTIGTKTIDHLEIKEPKAKDFKGVKIPTTGELDFGLFIQLGSKLTSEPPSTLGELSSEDFFALVEVISSFLPGAKALAGPTALES